MEALERRIGQRRDATRAPTRGPEWRGGSGRPKDQISDSVVHNLLDPKNGLDSGVHLSRLVVEALSGPVINRINVTHAGHTITGRSLVVIANRVIDREIGVVVDSKVGSGEAEYDSGSDTFHLGFSSASTRTRKALIVHEAVHAALDMQTASGVTIAQSESLAYVVQCFYVREYTADPDAERLTSSNPLKDKVYEIAWDMAGILAKRKQPEQLYWNALDSAIRRHPTYKKNAGKQAGFDGI